MYLSLVLAVEHFPCQISGLSILPLVHQTVRYEYTETLFHGHPMASHLDRRGLWAWMAARAIELPGSEAMRCLGRLYSYVDGHN